MDAEVAWLALLHLFPHLLGATLVIGGNLAGTMGHLCSALLLATLCYQEGQAADVNASAFILSFPKATTLELSRGLGVRELVPFTSQYPFPRQLPLAKPKVARTGRYYLCFPGTVSKATTLG